MMILLGYRVVIDVIVLPNIDLSGPCQVSRNDEWCELHEEWCNRNRNTGDIDLTIWISPFDTQDLVQIYMYCFPPRIR